MRRLARRWRDRDQGATMVEFAMIFGFLMMLALGAFEYGMLFRDWLAVSVASREGGRVAASAANFGEADCVILEAVNGALQSLNSGTVQEVHIYKSSATGSYPGSSSLVVRYRPPASPEPNPLIICSSGATWAKLPGGGSWEPDDRVNTLGSADWIGVRVKFQHEWLTNFVWWTGTVDFQDDTVFRMEPPDPRNN